MSAVEAEALVELPGGRLHYTLRRSPRSRGLRVTVHPERGVVVSVPLATRRGWTRPERLVESFLREREPWLRRHLARQADARHALAARPPLDAGRPVPFRGEPHRVRLTTAPAGVRRSRVARVGGEEGDELVVELAPGDRRPVARLLEDWLRARARADVEAALARHAPALGVRPASVTIRDTRSRWGSCSRAGRLSLSWRLVLAPPAALEAVVVHELCHLRVFGHGPRFHALVESRMPDHAAWRRWLHRHSAELHAALDETPPAGAAVA